MRRNKRGPKPPTGSGAPIRHVLGLGVTSGAFEHPIHKQSRYGEGLRGEKILLSERRWLDHAQVPLELVALRGGNIGFERVVTAIKISAAQRRQVRYEHDGRPDFSDHRQVFKPVDWEMLKQAGQLVVLTGQLVRMPGGVQFGYTPEAWDVADQKGHQNGHHPTLSPGCFEDVLSRLAVPAPDQLG